MFEYLEKLRAKPPKAKKRIAFLVSFSLAGIIFILWLSVIYPDFRQRQSQIESAGNSDPSPLSHFGEVFSNSFYSIGESFSKIKESLSSLATSSSSQSTTTTATSTAPVSFIE